MSPEGEDLAPELGGHGGGLAPELGSRSPHVRPWWQSLRGPIGVLLAGLDGKHATERRRAIEALVRLGDRRAVPALAECVRDPHFTVRLAAVEALATLGGGEVLAGLHRALRDGHPAVRLAAASGVVRHGTRASLGPMSELVAYLAGFAPQDAARAQAALDELRRRLGEGLEDS